MVVLNDKFAFVKYDYIISKFAHQYNVQLYKINSSKDVAFIILTDIIDEKENIHFKIA